MNINIRKQKEQMLIEEDKTKELEHIKQMERDKIKYESMVDINITDELEDIEFYI